MHMILLNVTSIHASRQDAPGPTGIRLTFRQRLDPDGIVHDVVMLGVDGQPIPLTLGPGVVAEPSADRGEG